MPSFRRPSPSLIVAFVALFVALGGVGYSAAKINGKNLKNRSVTGKKVKNDTVTGKQVKESSLGKVPAAVSADIAANAANAAKLGGVAAGSYGRKARWAFVRGSTGGIINQTGGIAGTRVGGGGHYYVDFGASLTDAALSANVTSAAIGEAAVGRCGGGDGGVTCDPAFNSPNIAEVFTYDWAGPGATLGDRNTYVVALPK